MRYDQPFCVINSRGHFVGARFNYLPQLEEPDTTKTLQDALHDAERDTEWSARQWDIIDQLRGEVKHIHLELHKIQGQRLKKRVYNKYE